MSTFISVEEAQRQILTKVPTTGAERIQLAQSQGRRLLEPIEAPWDAPRFDNSAMDGVALRWADLKSIPATLSIIAEAAAGRPTEVAVESGQACRISTGAALPTGADTVVPRELCRMTDREVTVRERPSKGKGANIRRAGTYLKCDDPALQTGTLLGGAEVGLLASFGTSVIVAHTRPRVAIISTGDELVELDRSPGPGQIVNSNAYMLEALVRSHGGIAQVYPTAPDHRDAIAATFERAISECDFVISSGGVSVGDHDHVGAVVDEICDGMAFWKVRIKPGKPLAFGSAPSQPRPVPLIGLPGNPGAGFVGFHLFVRPALAVAQGLAPDEAPLPRISAHLKEGVRGSRGRRAYLSGRAVPAGDELQFKPSSHQSSGNPALFANANALGIVDESVEGLQTGDRIPIHLL